MLIEKPLVSVIIPTHNRPKLVRRAVFSVIEQSYRNIEIIVVDDASEMIIADELSNYKPVKVIRNKRNRGGCYSRNKGIEIAKGSFINFLDDDDILLPKKIEKQIEAFNQSDDLKLGMVTCHTLDKRSGKEIIRLNRVQGDIYKDVLCKFLVSGIETMLFKKEALLKIKGFDQALPSNHEYDLLIRFAEYYTVGYVDEVLTTEFRSVNQISLNFKKKTRGARYLYHKHDKRYRSEGILFWLKMRMKLFVLLSRFFIGKIFGEKVYRILLFESFRNSNK